LTLGSVRGRTIDEIIAGSSNAVTDFDFIATSVANVVRVELDMMMSLKQYQELYVTTVENNDDLSSLSRKKRKAIKQQTYRWTNKEIPYRMDDATFSAQDKAEVTKAIVEWQNYTCISFRRASSADANFVNFQDGSGCSSYVGMNGGKHPISLAGGCRVKGVIQNRPDRDDYIIIQTENIMHPTLIHNFKKYPWSAVSTYEVPYDYRSIMHYGGTAFSGNGQYTIKTKDPAVQNVIGNRSGLSFNDIKLANLMYSCQEKCDPGIVCPGQGFVRKDCQCWCPGNPIQKCKDSDGRSTTQSPAVKTTQKPTAMPTAMACQDMNTHCAAWAGDGYCMTNNYVKTYCKVSCSMCTLNMCKDVREHCSYWAEQGYCTNDTYKNFMAEKCSLSCGICKFSSASVNSVAVVSSSVLTIAIAVLLSQLKSL
ncbi:unnamed protein product, partial [Candidula unifasciata]